MSQFEKKQDAQGLWRELCKKYEEGMGPEDLTNQLQDKWKYFKCDHYWTCTHESFLDNWVLHLKEYEEAKGDEISDDDHQRVLCAALAPRPLFHSCTTNGQLLSTVLRAHSVTSDKMTYPVFFELVCVHAKTLDQQKQSSSEAKHNANQTRRQQQPQKSNKKDKKQIPANEKIIWKNN